MKLKSLFYILALLLVAVWLLVLFVATEENGWKFYAIESAVTVSIIYLAYFYR